MKPIRSLDDLMNGAALERFNRCLDEVLKNIQDQNTDAKKTRKITMTLTVKPDKSRNSAKFLLAVSPGLAPIEPYEVNVMLARDDKGNTSAAEFGNEIPGQMDVEDVQQGGNVTPLVIGGRRSG